MLNSFGYALGPCGVDVAFSAAVPSPRRLGRKAPSRYALGRDSTLVDRIARGFPFVKWAFAR